MGNYVNIPVEHLLFIDGTAPCRTTITEKELIRPLNACNSGSVDPPGLHWIQQLRLIPSLSMVSVPPRELQLRPAASPVRNSKGNGDWPASWRKHLQVLPCAAMCSWSRAMHIIAHMELSFISVPGGWADCCSLSPTLQWWVGGNRSDRGMVTLLPSQFFTSAILATLIT